MTFVLFFGSHYDRQIQFFCLGLTFPQVYCMLSHKKANLIAYITSEQWIMFIIVMRVWESFPECSCLWLWSWSEPLSLVDTGSGRGTSAMADQSQLLCGLGGFDNGPLSQGGGVCGDQTERSHGSEPLHRACKLIVGVLYTSRARLTAGRKAWSQRPFWAHAAVLCNPLHFSISSTITLLCNLDRCAKHKLIETWQTALPTVTDYYFQIFHKVCIHLSVCLTVFFSVLFFCSMLHVFSSSVCADGRSRVSRLAEFWQHWGDVTFQWR